MSETERRLRYDNRRVLIETERVLDPQFRSTLLTLSGAQVELLRNIVAYLNRASTFATEYFGTYYLTPTASEWDSLQSIVADLEDLLMGIIAQEDYVCVRDKKADSVDGGTFTLGAWRKRDINEEQADAAGICGINNSQITLSAGTYRCLVSAPAYAVNRHKLRLYNVSDSVVVLEGTAEYSSTYSGSRSFVVGRFVLAGEKTLEVQHQCSFTRASIGFGNSAKFGDEIYTVAEFWRRL